jgi:hypothetical protein
MGKDISLDRLAGLAEKSLVGTFFFIKMLKPQLKKWIWDF